MRGSGGGLHTGTCLPLGDQDNPGPRAGSHDRPVEVEGPVLVRDFWSRSLDFHPLGDEIGQGLGLYRRAWHELDIVAHQLDCPFENPSHGVAVALLRVGTR